MTEYLKFVWNANVNCFKFTLLKMFLGNKNKEYI